jgi:trk system potassium uptake protein TrkH
MNYRFVINQLGLLLLVLSAVMLLVAAWAVLDWLIGGSAPIGSEALLFSAGAGFLLGGVMWLYGRRARNDKFGRREALLLVGVCWFTAAALSALPFWLWAHLAPSAPPEHPFQNYIDCYFESMSGLTTTGATILTAVPSDIESLPRGLLLWRALTHWLGGLGIVVLFVAVLPTIGVGGKKLFHTEAPGPTQTGVRPRIKETAQVLWYIYIAMTAVLILILKVCGLTWFDSVCHTFATVATGGFSTRNASIGDYGTLVKMVIVVFMILAGINFGLYYQLFKGSAKDLWRDTELRFYLVTMSCCVTVISVSLYTAQMPITLTTGEVVDPSLSHVVEQSVFTSASIQTTTGFCTSDFNEWPFAAHAALVVMMFMGGCAGSTSGGIKVIRIWIVIKLFVSELHSVFNPNVVRPTRVATGTVDAETRQTILAYVLGVILLALAGSSAVMVLETGAIDYNTAATASFATLLNIGPGFGRVGAMENYAFFTTASKMVLSLLMLLGRLEVFAILVLLTPRFWRGE